MKKGNLTHNFPENLKNEVNVYVLWIEKSSYHEHALLPLERAPLIWSVLAVH